MILSTMILQKRRARISDKMIKRGLGRHVLFARISG